MIRNFKYTYKFKFTITISVLLSLTLVLLGITLLPYNASAAEELQIGEEWSRIPYNNVLTTDAALNNAIKATAKIVSPTYGNMSEQGTAFYLGKFQGKYLMMTNFHVMSESLHCMKGARVYFQMDKRRIFKCSTIVAKFQDLETVFFTIHVSKKDEYLFENLALKFDFKNSYKPGDRLVTAGYGYFQNSRHILTYENSATCLVASDTSAPRFLIVKDPSSRKKFNSWSFVHSCETSHGDSGSALVSEVTGKVVGINWATSIQKPEILKNSAVVFDWIQNQNPLIWSQLSYGIPNKNILLAVQQENNEILNEFINFNLQQSFVSN